MKDENKNFDDRVTDNLSESGTKEQKPWIRLINLLLLAALLYFVGKAIVHQIIAIKWDSMVLDKRFLLLSVMAAISARICVGTFYGTVLSRLNTQLPWRITMAVSWVSLLGKYVPGKIGVLTGVIYLLARYNVKASISAIVTLLSNGMTVLIALVLSAPLLLTPWACELIPFSRVWFIFLLVSGCIALRPRYFIGISNLILKLFGSAQFDINLTYRDMFAPILLVLFQCIFMGLATWGIARAVSSSADITVIPIVVSISSIAGAFGIIALFAPAGFGVIEGIYLLMLGPIIGPGPAALVAVCFRLLQTIIDILIAGAGALLLRNTPSQQI